MSRNTITNMAASVLARLKNLSLSRKQDYQHLLLRYATERFLYRLSISPHADSFVLKGGNLFVIWQNGNNSRPTLDSDLLCFGDTSHEHLRKVFASIARMEDSDGITFTGCNFGYSNCDINIDGGNTILFIANMFQSKPPITITGNNKVHFVNNYDRDSGALIEP